MTIDETHAIITACENAREIEALTALMGEHGADGRERECARGIARLVAGLADQLQAIAQGAAE